MQPFSRVFPTLVAAVLAVALGLPGVAQAVIIRITGDEPPTVLAPLPDLLKIRGLLDIPLDRFGADSGTIDVSRWTKLQILVDDGSDWTEIYYDDSLFAEYSWTGGVLGAAGALSHLKIIDFSLGDAGGATNPDTSLPYSFNPATGLGLTGNLDTYAIRDLNGNLLAQGSWSLVVQVPAPGIVALMLPGLVLLGVCGRRCRNGLW